MSECEYQGCKGTGVAVIAGDGARLVRTKSEAYKVRASVFNGVSDAGAESEMQGRRGKPGVRQ